MIKALIVAMLLSVSAHAETLDSVVNKINSELSPKQSGQSGFNVEYRQEKEAVWINIEKVTLVCSNDPVYVLNNGKIETGTEGCNYRVTDIKNALYQITCFHSTASRCKKLLATQLSTNLIKQITTRNIKDVYVK